MVPVLHLAPDNRLGFDVIGGLHFCPELQTPSKPNWLAQPGCQGCVVATMLSSYLSREDHVPHVGSGHDYQQLEPVLRVFHLEWEINEISPRVTAFQCSIPLESKS